MRSYRIKVDPDPMPGVLIRGNTETRTVRRPREDRQRLELFCHKPGNGKDCQPAPESGKRQGRILY